MNGWMDEGVSSNAPLLSASGSTADFLADLQAGSVHTSFLSSDGALYTCKLLIVLHCHIDIICLSISACLSVCLSVSHSGFNATNRSHATPATSCLFYSAATCTLQVVNSSTTGTA